MKKKLSYFIVVLVFLFVIKTNVVFASSCIDSIPSNNDACDYCETDEEKGNCNARKAIYDYAKVVLKNTDRWIYLSPNRRNKPEFTIPEGEAFSGATGGYCETRVYFGKTCVEFNGNKYYGTDCNGFVAHVYHNSSLGSKLEINVTDENHRYFRPDTENRSKGWYFNHNAFDYFERINSKSIDEIKDQIQVGDAIARNCTKPKSNTHIGIYIGNGYTIENKGGGEKPIKKLKLNDFFTEYEKCTYTLFKLKAEMDSDSSSTPIPTPIDPYEDDSCEHPGFFGCADVIKCGDNIELPTFVPQIFSKIVLLFKLGAVILLLIIGMIDMLKATVARDENKIKESKNKLIRRLIAGSTVFLVVTIIQTVLRLAAPDQESLIDCFDCLVNGDDSCWTSTQSSNN